MRIAVLSITPKGARLAEQLAGVLEGEIDVFAKAGRNPAGAKEYEHLGQLVPTLFHQYDGFVFIMPVGIVVRVIAPHVRDKRYDPAVVVVDEGGSYAISLLSGNLGGANALTRRVGDAMGAQSIITTTAQGLQKPTVDILAVKLNAIVEPFDRLREIDQAIVNGQRVGFFLDSTLANGETYSAAAEEMDIELINMKQLSEVADYDAAVVITDKDLYMVKPHIFLRPTTLVIGLGCHRGTASADILAALDDACKKVGRSPKSIAVIATSADNEEEIGILATAQQIEVPLRFFSHDKLCQVSTNKQYEAAALLAGKTDTLILQETQYQKVTIAITEVQASWWK